MANAKMLTMRVTGMTPTALGVKLTGFRVADNEILEKYPLEFEFIPEKHGIENFPRIGQEVQISAEGGGSINKIVYFTMRAPRNIDNMSDEDYADWVDNYMKMVKTTDANDNIIAAPKEIVRALGISDGQLDEIRDSKKELSENELFNLLSVDGAAEAAVFKDRRSAHR